MLVSFHHMSRALVTNLARRWAVLDACTPARHLSLPVPTILRPLENIWRPQYLDEPAPATSTGEFMFAALRPAHPAGESQLPGTGTLTPQQHGAGTARNRHQLLI